MSEILNHPPSSVPSAMQANIITDHVLNTFDYLQSLPHKKPHPVLNDSLTQLVALVSPVYDPDVVKRVMAHRDIQNNRQALTTHLATCEYELEMHWAEKIVADEAHYDDYPYIDCYRGIVAAETALVTREMFLENKAACFIGSGPMPLTALVLHKAEPTLSITCIERERQALDMSREVCGKSDAGLRHQYGEADQVDYAPFDVVFVASMTEGKRGVFERIAETARPGTLVAARTVEDLRHLLYEPIDDAAVPDALLYAGKTPYNPHHVNTTTLYKLA